MVKVIVGMMGSSVAKGSSSLATPEQVRQFLACVKSHGIKELDTARVYNSGRSEELLGEVHASLEFEVSTKAPGFMPGSLAEPNVLAACEASLKALQQAQCDIYYIHGPDMKTPLEEQARAFNTLHKQGKFKRFGVSNLSDNQVKTIHDICKTNSWVPPTVYQGGFSPLHRGASKTLRPLLKELGMAYYAFSPFAGGLLAKPIDQILNPAKNSRFEAMPVFKDLFVNDTIIEGLKKHTQICQKNGISVMEATARWFMHHSGLSEEDGMLIGASTTEQVDASLTATEKGPLPEDVAQSFESMWKEIEHAAPGYHS